MQPLQAILMPTHGALIGVTTENSWASEGARVRFAFVATNSTQSLSFVSLQAAAHPEHVIRLASRPAFDADFQHGVVIEVYLGQDLLAGEAVYVNLAQAGATVYFPAQAIEG